MGYFKDIEIENSRSLGKDQKLYAGTIGEFNFFTRGKSPAEAKANLNYRYFMRTGRWVGVDSIDVKEVGEILDKQFNNGQMEMIFTGSDFLRFAERGAVEINLKEAII